MSATAPRITPNVVGLGESLLRLAAPDHQRLEQAASLGVEIGGAEMNALIGASALGMQATWLTRLPDNPLGRRIAAHARASGVRAVVEWDEHARAALYFVEHGAAPRHSEVLYDRTGSALTALGPETFDWPRELEGASAALSTGITCALGDGPAAAVSALFAHAQNAGVQTVFDVNHRSRLWTWEEAIPVLQRVVGGVDILLASEHDLHRLLESSDSEGQAAAELARRVMAGLGPRMVVLRDSGPLASGRVGVSVTAITQDASHRSASFEAEVVDPFGAGDAAVAGFLAGLLLDNDLQAAVDTAAWACAFQHTIPGDAWRVRPSDLLARDEAERRVLR